MTTIRTVNSDFHFDFANRKVTRVTRVGYEMRRDNEMVRMDDMLIPEIGKGMSMIISVREDGIGTIRTTSAVLEIE